MLLAVHLTFTGLFCLLGVIFSFGKGASLIAGYNTSSSAEKQKINETKLCKAMAKLMFTLAACWLVVASSEIFKKMFLLWLGLLLFIAVIIIAVIYMNTGDRFKK